MNLRILGAGGGALLAAGLAVSPATAAVAIDGSVFQQATSTLAGFPTKTDAHSDDWKAASAGGVGPRDLHTFAESEQFLSTDTGFNEAVVGSVIDAHWNGTNRGTVDLSNRGWSIAAETLDSVQAQLNTPATGLPDWSYAFTADHGGTFDLGFRLSGSDEDFGIGTWDLLVSEDGGPAQVTPISKDFDFDQVTRTGTISQALEVGHDYRVSLRSLADVTIGRTDQGFVAAEVDHFDWTIAEPGGAPEPSTWALTIAGFGLVGATLRRRRPALASRGAPTQELS